MICLICRQAEIVDGLTSVIFERGEIKVLIDKVPARVCPHCGEAYVSEEVAAKLLWDAQEVSRMGMFETAIGYDSLA